MSGVKSDRRAAMTGSSIALRWVSRGQALPLHEYQAWGYRAIDCGALHAAGASTWSTTNFLNYADYAKLIPINATLWSPQRAGTKRGSLDLHDIEDPSIYWGTPRGELPAEPKTAAQMIEWLTSCLPDLELAPDQFSRLFHDPEKLVTVGYRLAYVEGRAGRPNSARSGAALCMVGLGALCYWSNDETCELCFRKPVPGLDRCGLHSQSKANLADGGNDAAERSHDARTARNIIRRAGCPPPKYTGGPLSNLNFGAAIAGILWPMRLNRVTAWRQDIASMLAQAPIVSSRLPPNFNTLPEAQQQMLLRRLIDPNEWSSYAWWNKIGRAERWFAAERSVSPGVKTGLSEKSRVLFVDATRMLSEGLSKTQIAGRLNLSKSHLSHLLSRGRKDGG